MQGSRDSIKFVVNAVFMIVGAFLFVFNCNNIDN